MNEDITRYLERAHEALESARILHQSQHYLDSVSRAYYAMYHVAMAALIPEGVSVKTHKGTIGLFYQRLIATGKLPPDLGRAFSFAFEKRTSGDYEAYFELEEVESAKILADSESFLTIVCQYIDENFRD